MHTFLTEDNEDESRIFKLVKQDDFQPTMNEFDGIKVNTLAGKCTRSLHQIKASEEKGFRMERPFSCLCTNCRAEAYEKCFHIDYTKGIFKKHKLPSNEEHYSGKENYFEKDNDHEEENPFDDDLSQYNHLIEEEEQKYSQVSRMAAIS